MSRINRSLLRKTILICSCSFLTLLVLLAVVVYNLPQLPGVPEAPVVASPPEMKHAPLAPYQGIHPRFKERPKESFAFPIPLGEVGPVEPLFAPQNKYPFLCGKDSSRDAQPLVDNQQGLGVPVFALDGEGQKTDVVIGYSKDCLLSTRAAYYYNREGTHEFYPLEEADDDIEQITVGGRKMDFVVRLETGTINRFIYAMAVLRGESETLERPDGTYWNKRLIYQFRGGVGVGKRQGEFGINDIVKRRYEELKQGYGIVYSTANRTKNHYNIWLAEDTALRVKRQFTALYGEPLYTVGVGGSGGAIQQYLFAQNNPDILDAAIPLYSYPDMVSQTIYVMDCEPLEYYFDVLDGNDSRWRDWEKRSWLEGMSADSKASNKFQRLTGLAALMTGNVPLLESGSSGCVEGWRGLTPLVNNPHFVHFSNSFSPEVASRTHWTHWEDLKHFYGVDERGYANSTWDNVGVQYGLQSLQKRLISPADFLRINASVGGWKPPHQMQQERLWVLAGNWFPVDLSFWSHHNMYQSADGGETPAQRTAANVKAIEGAYRSGLVFLGYADIPIIDLRHYLDKDLDMHHAAASFSTRARMLQGQGSADNQVIWMTAKPHNPVAEAFAVMDQWMLNIMIRPDLSVADNKPMRAEDKCFDRKGRILAKGDGVWDGDWNGRPEGACMSIYPRHKTSREIAGAGIEGNVFKCELQLVSKAIDNGVYGDVDMQPYLERLEQVFPEGVCDFSKPDRGLPKGDWFTPVMLAERQVEEHASFIEPVVEVPARKPMPPQPITLSKLDSEFSSVPLDGQNSRLTEAVPARE